ncbi:hypothetical protein L208DRAFT_1302428 [Tricholoma matsutake]|nr:hypothetical protein L208DRAFT_1302428 [Tricholoma matsutake 945]
MGAPSGCAHGGKRSRSDGHPLFCKSCCSQSHATTPFHHVEHWVGNHYLK